MAGSSPGWRRLLEDDKLGGIPLFVFANKQDLVNAVPADEISETLKLQEVSDRAWTIQACCATNGEGLSDGLQWIVEQRPSTPAA